MLPILSSHTEYVKRGSCNLHFIIYFSSFLFTLFKELNGVKIKRKIRYIKDIVQHEYLRTLANEPLFKDS